MGYFGTNEDIFPSIPFAAGQWTGQYEAGKLRYLCLGNCEVIRMIYPAIRDQHWRTAPTQILNEKLEIGAGSFRIEYSARYQLETVDYQARYVLQGDAQGQLSVEMWGEALSDFMRNRIGLCVLHPIDSCTGKAVSILHPDATQSEVHFPTLISPHQPFIDVQGMHWSPAPGLQVQLHFEGEIFETEDQRNWTDSSYKTYSTPLSISFPVQVQKGETLYQKLTLEYQAETLIEINTSAPVEIKVLEQSYPFPQLGTDWNPQLNAEVPKLALDFLNVLLNLEDSDCTTTLQGIVPTAQQLGIKIGLSVLMPETYFLPPFINTLQSLRPHLQHLCILSNPIPSTVLMEEVYTTLKTAFPDLPIGYGTDGFFTQLNRNRPQTTAFDFVQFSFNPQVHADDTRTIIENLSAQRDVVLTAQNFAQGKPIHVAPITLRWRYNPDPAVRIDPRQHSELAAAWMLLSLKYLAPCAALSYFEWVGEKGILSAEGNTPLADYLLQISQFKPTTIVDTYSSNPLKKDLLLLENAQGKLLGFEVDFEAGEITELN